MSDKSDLRLNDLIQLKQPMPEADYEVTLCKSDIVSMLRTAMREGADIVLRHADKFQMNVSNVDIDNYSHVVSCDVLNKFAGDK